MTPGNRRNRHQGLPERSGSGWTRPPASPGRRRPVPRPATPRRVSRSSLDVDQLLYEANTLLNGATLLNRCIKEKSRD